MTVLDEMALRKKIEDGLPMPTGEFFAMHEEPVRNIGKCAEMVVRAVREKWEVHVIADYDCDGVVSGYLSYLMFSYLDRDMGAGMNIRFPRRISEGYGISVSIVDEIQARRRKKDALLVTVDNGIRATEALERALGYGFRVMVVDHHLALPGYPGNFPDVDCVVNQSDGTADTSARGYSPYCGAGLVLKVMEEIGREHPYPERVMNTARVLAGIATVADVVPLINGNRRIVGDSLSLIRDHAPVLDGTTVLLSETGLDSSRCTEDDFGYRLGPLFNAPGRMYDNGAQKVASFLASKGDRARKAYAWIAATNEERKSATQEAMRLAGELTGDGNGDGITIVASPGFPLGICGIVAGELAEKLGKPAIVFHVGEDGRYKGSARTYGDTDITAAISEGGGEWLAGFGGHKGAAGLRIGDEFDYMGFVQGMRAWSVVHSGELRQATESAVPVPFVIEPRDIEMADRIVREYAPYGESVPAPSFAMKKVGLFPSGGQFMRTMGKKGEHVKLFLDHGTAVGFNKTARYRELGYPLVLDLYGRVGMNVYLGQASPQFEVSEMSLPEDG